jgi:hypothetical protein
MSDKSKTKNDNVQTDNDDTKKPTKKKRVKRKAKRTDKKPAKKKPVKKKTGPKKPYAIDNLMKVLSEEKIKEIKLKYYIHKVPKYKLAKEIGLSHQLMAQFLERIGKLTAEDIKDI